MLPCLTITHFGSCQWVPLFSNGIPNASVHSQYFLTLVFWRLGFWRLALCFVVVVFVVGVVLFVVLFGVVFVGDVFVWRSVVCACVLA